MTDLLIQQLAAFGEGLTPEQRSQLHVIHEAIGWSCAAHAEGLNCCVDSILGDHE
ncbi:hypothetical protein ACFWPU_00865 [Streptomyces sp. NPDC058471]|uniref:hypothetical protein n=1 Tax=Streptomyces sp. NPDC058471 TaxID=3346516 RepID=UPI00365DB9AD